LEADLNHRCAKDTSTSIAENDWSNFFSIKDKGPIFIYNIENTN
jgi:hypothetical protein